MEDCVHFLTNWAPHKRIISPEPDSVRPAEMLSKRRPNYEENEHQLHTISQEKKLSKSEQNTS